MSSNVSIRVGDTFADKYRVESELGSGGMGVVFGALDPVLKRHVAIKLLTIEAAKEPSIVGRFMREGRVAVGLRSEHIASVIDYGVLPSGDPYLVTERLDGKDLLRVLMESKRPLEVPRVVDWIRQTCEGLHEAHAAGIIHRDLKPANLFLAKRDDGSSLIKILDFGICKVDDRTQPSLTQANELLGTPRYMSPEQLGSGGEIDARTDIWAIGVILYELLTKTSPFDGDRVTTLMIAVSTSTPIPLHEARTDVPRELSRIVARCLEKKSEDRYRDVMALSRDLASLDDKPHASRGRHDSETDLFVRDVPRPPTVRLPDPDRDPDRDRDHDSEAEVMTSPPTTPTLQSMPDRKEPPSASPITPTMISGQPSAPPPPRQAKANENEANVLASYGEIELVRFGRYVRSSPLASGGMASVHFGVVIDDDTGALRPVALKRLRSDLTDPNFATMLTDEARIAGRVRHPNVVGTLDVIALQGEMMIAFEYVPGVSLSQALHTTRARTEHVPAHVAAAIVIDTLQGLQAAHVATDLHGEPLEIVHRDVSPQNILLDESGAARLADFGIASARGRLQRTTETGSLKGKLGYLAPEQVHGKISRAVDIYACGCILWELLAGRPLFRGTDGEILAGTLMGKVDPPSTIAGAAPRANLLDDVALKALAREPADRYATAEEMADAIAARISPASHAEVAHWLEVTNQVELERRRALVERMLAAIGGSAAVRGLSETELAPYRPDEAPATRQQRLGMPHGIVPVVAPALGQTVPPAARSSTARKMTTTIVAGLLVLLVMGVVLAFSKTLVPSTPTTDPASVSPSASSSSVVASSSLTASSEPSSSSTPTAASSSAAEPSSSSSLSIRPGSAKGPRPKPPTKAPPPSGKVDCSTPYTIDADGHTIWKRECFKK